MRGRSHGISLPSRATSRPPAEHHLRPDISEVRKYHQVGALAGSDGSAVEQAEVVGGVECSHGDRHVGRHAFRNGGADQVIHVPLIQEVGGLPVVGAETDARAIGYGEPRDQREQIRAFVASRMNTTMPRRSFSRISSTVVASWSEPMPAAT